MRIALYSGSFDPLHIGHLAILRALCGSELYDKVLLVVSPRNPLKGEEKALNAKSRLEAARASVSRHSELDKVEVSDIEFELEPPHYTIRTLDALQAANPGDSFTLVIGADNLSCIRRWKDYRRLLSTYGVQVYPRQGYELEQIRKSLIAEDPSYIIGIIDAPTVDISSSFIREAAARGESVEKWLM